MTDSIFDCDNMNYYQYFLITYPYCVFCQIKNGSYLNIEQVTCYCSSHKDLKSRWTVTLRALFIQAGGASKKGHKKPGTKQFRTDRTYVLI